MKIKTDYTKCPYSTNTGICIKKGVLCSRILKKCPIRILIADSQIFKDRLEQIMNVLLSCGICGIEPTKKRCAYCMLNRLEKILQIINGKVGNSEYFN